MTELIAFDIYQTERMVFEGNRHTVNFTKRKDGEEYALVAVNDATGKSWRCSYSAEAAADFRNLQATDLANKVYELRRIDIARGAI